MPPILSPNEQRVLGCLLEKEVLTPEAYPLTLNSLKLACNQKTSREPGGDLSEAELSQALAVDEAGSTKQRLESLEAEVAALGRKVKVLEEIIQSLRTPAAPQG